MVLDVALWFVPMFTALWLTASGALAHLSGWRMLARRHAALRPPDGERIAFSSIRLGWLPWFPVRYRNCVTVVVGKSGIGLSMFLPFRFLSPALLVPWTHVESVQEVKGLFDSSAKLRIGDGAVTLTLHGRAASSVIDAWRRTGDRGQPA